MSTVTFRTFSMTDVIETVDPDWANIGPGNVGGFAPFLFGGRVQKHTRDTVNYHPVYVPADGRLPAIDNGDGPGGVVDPPVDPPLPVNCTEWDDTAPWVDSEPWCE